MATKLQVLNDDDYEPSVVMGMIKAARTISLDLDSRKRAFARLVLTNPWNYVPIFKYLVIVNLDTTNWGSMSETAKISATEIEAYNVFSQAGNIIP